MTVLSTCSLGPPHPTRELYYLPKPNKEAQGLIWPSSFPIDKKDKSLHTCFLKIVCHPGFYRALAVILQMFCWLCMSPDTKKFITACSVCAHNKSSLHAPASLLCYLLIPHCPSRRPGYVSTGHPPSEAITTIIRVHNFSKVVPFFPPYSKFHYPKRLPTC